MTQVKPDAHTVVSDSRAIVDSGSGEPPAKKPCVEDDHKKTVKKVCVVSRDVTDFKSASKSDGIRHFFGNPKSVGHLKCDRNGFKIFVSV